MWRQVAIPVQFLPPNLSPSQLANDTGVDTHSHSPRRQLSSITKTPLPAPAFGPMPPPTLFPRCGAGETDPFNEQNYNPWMGRQPSADASMPDYSSSTTFSRRVSEPMSLDRPFQYDMQSAGAFDALCEALIPSAPVNTPQHGLKASKIQSNDLSERQGKDATGGIVITLIKATLLTRCSEIQRKRDAGTHPKRK